MTSPDTTTADLFARTAINSWKQNLARLDQMFTAFSDADLQQEIAPGKNRIFYLLGHLTAVHDRMLPLLGLGPRRHEDRVGQTDKEHARRSRRAPVNEAHGEEGAGRRRAIPLPRR